MEIIEIAQLYDFDYSVTDITGIKQFWRDSTTFNCIEKPKQYNMLLFLDGCNAEYIFKNGETYHFKSGSIIYVPISSEYKVHLYDFENKDSNTIGINFLLYDSKNRPFKISDSIKCLSTDGYDFKPLFEKFSQYNGANIICRSKIKSILYDILFKLSEFYHNDYSNKFKCISKGIQYLENNEEQDLKISEIASMCHVSEVYFRKLFKKYSGMSPAKFKLHTRISKAKNYLRYDDLTISEISDLLGFNDVSYFIKTFKEIAGMTPNKYRTNFKDSL